MINAVKVLDREVDQSINESRDIKTTLEDENCKMKEQVEKLKEEKWKKFMDRPGYGYCTPKTDSHKEEKLKIRS